MAGTEKARRIPTFDWRLLAYAALSSVLMLPFAAMANWDVGQALYVLVFFINGVVIAIVAGRKRGARMISILVALAVYAVASWPLRSDFYDVHTLLRWQITKNADRASLLAQPSTRGQFKHIDWDGWGFAGMDTEVYLVYDPGDSLSSASARNGPGKFAGIPCEVPLVRRLESHFYAVQFYTNTSWDFCPAP